jgi:hypothetical protein
VQPSAFENVPGVWAVLAGAAIVVLARLGATLFRRIMPRPRELGTDRAAIVALSEDLQRRIIDEQRGAIDTHEVLAWDARAYRLARLRLRARGQPADVQAALSDLDEARADLRTAWRFSKTGQGVLPEDLENALRDHATAIHQFADATAIFVRISWQQRWPNGSAA